ncbi:hypothetical protein AMAG_00069 [Allomyces macrogynus ATCC 38327]|uniref:Uncharacterized protein n=1 Tax=Allomyces macrogynus (strain ATCC 38327) TaxID=578462 RepID=A0A0L0RVH0_ALLM3|nr:hypothetical protein AMAG_00069 [Allomyces macrogynus ATCC 38327]|eukprot:KNE54066.1 hypothetical protein AMAG_00069 [Allomyces macrogynus ATCC 38327]
MSISGDHVKADTHEARQERAYLAAAHRESLSHESRLHAAEMAAELHFQRTGEYPNVSPEEEASSGPISGKQGGTAHHHTQAHTQSELAEMEGGGGQQQAQSQAQSHSTGGGGAAMGKKQKGHFQAHTQEELAEMEQDDDEL